MTTASAEETRAFGAALGRRLVAGDVVFLRGPMGAGKTTLAQGIGAGLEVREVVCSPTFALVHEYAGRLPLWHVDAYRLQSAAEARDLGLAELAAGGVLMVEWPEAVAAELPRDRLEIELVPGEGDARELVLRPYGDRAETLVTPLTK